MEKILLLALLLSFDNNFQDDNNEFLIAIKNDLINDFSELQEMHEIILNMFDLSFDIFNKGNYSELVKLHELENKTDKLKTQLNDKHFERITRNECKNELSPFYSSLVSELERVADHLVNIGYSIVNPTGDADEK